MEEIQTIFRFGLIRMQEIMSVKNRKNKLGENGCLIQKIVECYDLNIMGKVDENMTVISYLLRGS